jgi:hypothetical protein
MLTENDVVNHVEDYLIANGYKILKKATTNQKGIDIIAVKSNRQLYVEAKGATSSKSTSKRFGKPFSNSQVSTHIAMGVLYAMLNRNAEIDFAFALPNNDDHTKMIERIAPSLKILGVKVYFVSNNGEVKGF